MTSSEVLFFLIAPRSYARTPTSVFLIHISTDSSPPPVRVAEVLLEVLEVILREERVNIHCQRRCDSVWGQLQELLFKRRLRWTRPRSSKSSENTLGSLHRHPVVSVAVSPLWLSNSPRLCASSRTIIPVMAHSSSS